MKKEFNKYSVMFAIVCMFFCFGCNPIQYKTVSRLYDTNEDITSKRLITTPYPFEYDTLVTTIRTTETYKWYEESFRKNKPNVIIGVREIPISAATNSKNISTKDKREPILKKSEKISAQKSQYYARQEIEDAKKTNLLKGGTMNSAFKAKMNDRITELSGLIKELNNTISIIDNYVIDSLMQRNPDREKMDVVKNIVNKGEAMTTSYFNIMIDAKDSIYSLTLPLNFSYPSGKWKLSGEAQVRINKIIDALLESNKNFEKDYSFDTNPVLYIHAYADEQKCDDELCRELNKFYPNKKFNPNEGKNSKEEAYRKYCNQLLSQKRADETREYIIGYIKEKQKQMNVITREIIGQGENYPYDSVNPPYKHNEPDERRRIVVISLGLSIQK